MTNKNTKTGGTNFIAEKLYATDLNDTFDYMASVVYTRDITGGSVTNTSFTDMVSVTVPGGTFKRLMWISFGGTTFYNITGAGVTLTTSVQLLVNTSVIDVIPVAIHSFNFDNDSGSATIPYTAIVPFRNTTDVDLTNDVTIQIQGKYTTAGAGSYPANYKYLYIYGI